MNDSTDSWGFCAVITTLLSIIGIPTTIVAFFISEKFFELFGILTLSCLISTGIYWIAYVLSTHDFSKHRKKCFHRNYVRGFT